MKIKPLLFSEGPESFTDKFGACKICDGEIPDGHQSSCYLYKKEQGIELLRQKLAAREKAAIDLWQIIDDIDTMSDIAKGDDKFYRARIEKYQKKRFKIFTSDGYDLFLPTGEQITDTNKLDGSPMANNAPPMEKDNE